MKKMLSNFGVRFATYIIGTVSAVVAVAGVLAMIIVYLVGTKEEVLEEGYVAITENYLAEALEAYLEGKGTVGESLEDVNLYYVIIKGIPVEDGDNIYDDENAYVFSNMPDGIKPKFEYMFYGKEGEVFHYNVDSLLGALGTPYRYSDSASYASVPVEQIVLDTNQNLFYFKTPVGYFLMDYVYIKEDGLYYDYVLNTVNGERCYYNSYFDRTLDIDAYESWTGIGWYDIRWTIDPNQTEKVFEAISDSNIIKEGLMSTQYFVSEQIHYDDSTESIYTIAAMLKPEFEKDDLLKEWHANVTLLYSLEESFIAYAFVAVILFILSVVVLVYTTKSNKEDLRFTHKCPLLIYLSCVAAMEVVLGILMVLVTDAIDTGLLNTSIENVAFILALLVALMALILLWCISNLATRIKSKTLFRYSVLYYISRPLVKLWKLFLRGCKKIRENMPLFWKVSVITILLDIIELVVLSGVVKHYYYFGFLVIFNVYKVLQFVVVLFVVFQMNALQKGSARIANGELEEPIDTSKMIWEFKKHGENINKVGDGISKAVENQLKSERFKTELITNVSHDIKTPLTSIINYVDLIKKEEYTDPTLCEYVEVLDRQSARLKKLIEDLMEASKASTGNLKVELEECDLSMLIGQVAGEFEDRFAVNGLETVITKPDEPIYIMADGRHMWRVLDNLMNNINKYTLSNTRVYIQLEKVGEKVVVQFKNISKTQLNISSEELMERFVRGDSSRNTEGSGLGLSIAQSLTELMGGTIELNIDGDLFKVILTFDVFKKLSEMIILEHAEEA